MPTKIPILFIGTGAIGVPMLRALAADKRFDVRLVVSQPDKPAGRKMELTPPPIKIAAQELGLPVFQPAKINIPETLDELRKYKPEMIVLMAYGKILKKELLDIPPKGCINVHASLLPYHRGASPIQDCLLTGDKKTGISIMRMDEGMDTGPVYATSEIPIADDDNAITLSEKLANLTATKTPDVLAEIDSGKLKPKPQDDSKSTLCTLIKKEDGEIKWSEPAETILKKIRAYAGWPGTHTFWNGKRLKILNAKRGNEGTKEQSGTVIQKDGDILVATGEGTIELLMVQMEGKKAQPIDEFVRGYKDFVGSKLGN